MNRRIRGYLHNLAVQLCPTEIFLLAFLALSGITVLLGLAPPDSLASLLPHGFVIVWELMLVFGSVVGITGALTLAWPVVRLGYTVLAPAVLAYGIALVPVIKTLTGWFSVGFLIVFALSCVWRIVQITHALRKQGDE